MNTRNDLAHILIALPKEQHRRLKTRAATLGTTMRELILEALDALDVCSLSTHMPNEETRHILDEIKEKKGLKKAKNKEEFIKKIRSI
ncbi:hypothetical protein H0X48_05990 [Candidatus Dependentiae bacterium]|nr:hypothetical protein [Candidatus Dependentiae bacterium]